ncbi:MAG: transcription-repair coupling factor [Candidatus Obscuribacterales bacterium]|nr:transcription-repair coupling factor [Candidatus Obscuribacterales bacterium]
MRDNVLAQALHQHFLDCSQYAKILARTAKHSRQELHITGLSDSAKSLVLSLLHHEIKRPFFLVAQDHHHAARYHQEISNLSRFNVFLYPASEVSPYEQVLQSQDTIAAQMELLQHIIKNESDPYIVILPARALMQRVLDRDTLTRNTLRVKKGDSLDLNTLRLELVRLGYSKESIVTLRGEFSSRGDIIDIFPSAGLPVRIELFGEEVESIRHFSAETQRSIEELTEIEIFPRWWAVLEEPDLVAERLRQACEKAQAELSESAYETLQSVIEADLQTISAKSYPESMEYYSSFINPEFCTLLHYVPENALLLFDEWDSVAMALKSNEKRLQETYDEGVQSGRLLPLPRPLHLTMEEFATLSPKCQRVFLVQMPGVESAYEGANGDKQSIVQFDCHNVDRFNSQLKQMVDKVKSWLKDGYRIIISSEQPQRVIGLLHEWDCPAVYLTGSNASGLIGESAESAAAGTSGSVANETPGPLVFGQGADKTPALPSSPNPKPGTAGPAGRAAQQGTVGPGSTTGSGGPGSATAGPAPRDSAAIGADGTSALHTGQGSGVSPRAGASQASAHGSSFSADWISSQSPGVWVTRQGFVGGFRLEDVHLISITDAELFGQKRKPTTYRRPVAEKNYERFTNIADLKVDDYVVHLKHGIGQFIGVQRIAYDNQTREYLAVQYSGDDRLYVPVDQINLLSRYRGSGDSAPRLSRLGGADWERTKKNVKKSVKAVAEELVRLYAVRAQQEGFQALPDTPWQYEMEEAFQYEETPDQWQAILDVKKDMESSKPMDRLICGDVGFGKTEVAIRSIFKTVMSGRQAVILVPTTVLAQQHFNTLCDRFAPYPIRVGLLSRFRTAREQKDVVNRLATGECDVVVGTHRLLQKDILFKDLGLVVIDEEHRFGVAHKEKLKQLRIMVDILTMSATPIPRTLNMAISGVRDMSLINTPPVNRSPVKTYVGEYRPQIVRTAILHELERGGQVFFLHNRVESIQAVALELKELCPEARITIGHGQMQERELENVMLEFANHEADILVCTTIIESGLDIPNANTIIIDQADRLGLAQLYQIRGRVGRSDLQAYCYCLYRPEKVITDQAQNRLKAIREFTTLGSGYQIALRDMEIRGVGNILGPEQHGFMIAVGFDLYCKLLGESVAEVQGQAVDYDADTQIDINVTAFIPDEYIPDPEHRIIEYKRLADVKSERELTILTDEWRDRFGPIPEQVQSLAQIVKLRLIASKAGVSAVKPDMVGLRMLVSYRLNQWLPVQNRLPKHLAQRTTYKPGSPGAMGPSPYILVKSDGLEPVEQLYLLEELLSAMVAFQQHK